MFPSLISISLMFKDKKPYKCFKFKYSNVYSKTKTLQVLKVQSFSKYDLNAFQGT